ncbi:MAG: aminopeptidase N [Paracoccaceae bacterium]
MAADRRAATATPRDQTVRLADYRAPDWLVERVSLDVDLAPRATRVTARIIFRRNETLADDALPPLALDGRRLTLVSAAVDGEDVTASAHLTLSREGLTLGAEALPGTRFEWTCVTEVDPEANTELEGLYLSNGMFCTQCEAQGFRKITYYPDRPDVMAPFTVRLEAPKATCPVLLSNGNPGEIGDLDGGRHYALWHDPFPKPAYLFALVAGDLVAHRDRFTTTSGRDVDLALWVRSGDEGKCAFAMDALKRSMAWDERAYGREYDLDVFQIVAVADFNMGAMENKGLNIFNSKYVLASPETATDRDYELIEGIVAHEYFHNWTGNRITCRDWFQLCLKEGLTVFRDQCFSEDERSGAVARIDQVKALRARQFAEDAGPLAHPVRPEAYVEINNFYTATVYEKGAEVIRMLHTLLGPETYRAAMDLYFERHDGEACTIENFRRCFEDASGRDLSQFARWWSVPGTPRVGVAEDWQDGTYRLTLSQRAPAIAPEGKAPPMVIPVAVGLLSAEGDEVAPTRVVELDGAEATVSFDLGPDAAGGPPPVPSLLRGFSAPVILERASTPSERAFLLAHDTDPFNRWEAGRRYALDLACDLATGRRAADEPDGVPDAWCEALGRVVEEGTLDPAFRALALEMPGNDEVSAEIFAAGTPADPDMVHAALTVMRRRLGQRLDEALARLYDALAESGPYSPDAAAAGRRALRNRAMALRLATGSDAAQAAAEAQFDAAANMTDAMAAMTALVHHDAPGAEPRLKAFRERWSRDELVMDKWFAVQATAPVADAVRRVEDLTGHPQFSWKRPNRFRAVVASFAMANPVGFHARDGEGYRFVTDWILRLDRLNPQTAARVAGAFERWRRYDEGRQHLVRTEMERLAATETLSKNTREIVERMLRG